MCTKCVHVHVHAFTSICVWVLYEHMGVHIVAPAFLDFCIRNFVKMSKRRKQLNSISATAFKTTRELANV